MVDINRYYTPYKPTNCFPNQQLDMVNQLWTKVIHNIHRLSNYKKAQLKNPEISADEKRKIPFSISSYEKWLVSINQHISSVPDQDPISTDSKAYLALIMKPPYGFTKGLAGRFAEVIDNGCFVEFIGQPPDAPHQPPNEPEPVKQAATTTHPAPVVSMPTPAASGTSSTQSVFETVEAIPKKLAEEGGRPGDDDPMGQRVYDLILITGIGEVKAKELANQGITLELLLEDWKRYATEDELRGCLETESLDGTPRLRFNELQGRLARYSEALPKLTHHQLIGVKYFHDIKHKIPREEIQKTEKYLQTIARHLNPKLHLQCCGSYRRGRDRSGDIDCLVYHEELHTPDDVAAFESVNGTILRALVVKLAATGFLTDHLSMGETKYMGVGHLPAKQYTIHRRIDIRFVPANSFGASLLYFTGSKNFNTTVRSQCLKKGYTLCEYGLFKIATDAQGKPVRDPKTKSYVKAEQVAIKTEEDFFQFLGIEYKTPKERDI